MSKCLNLVDASMKNFKFSYFHLHQHYSHSHDPFRYGDKMNMVHPSYCEIAHMITDAVDYDAANVAAPVNGGKSHFHLTQDCNWNW